MSATSPADNLSRYVRHVARRLWLANLLHGMARAAALIVLLFWMTLAVDYTADRWIEASVSSRGMLSIAWGCAVLLILWRWLIRTAQARPSEHSIALWIERHHPRLDDQLLTTIELKHPPEGMSPALINESARRAWEIVESLDPRQFVPLRRVRSIGLVAFLLVCSVILFGIFAPDVASIWCQRVVTLASTEYPRRTRLSMKSLHGELTKIPKGKDFTILVEIDPNSTVPKRAEITMQGSLGGKIHREPMIRQGDNHFRFVVRRPMESALIRVTAGDAKSTWHHLQIVESPLITRAIVTVAPPEYTGFGEQRIPLSGSAVTLPANSDVTISLSSSKGLVSSSLLEEESSIAMTKVRDSEFETRLHLDRSHQFRVHVVDRDGLTLADDFAIELTARPDRPPEISATYHGVSSGITRQARVPIRIEGEDDYGIERTEFEISVAGKSSREKVTAIREDVTSTDEEAVFDVSTYHLEPGTKCSVQIVGTDHLGQAGTSEKLEFEIITPEELMMRMAAQETTLRERFEQVVSELREAQRAVAEMDHDSMKGGPARRLACDRAMAIVRKGSGETESIALGFANIIEEFSNNQMGSADILERLGNGIRLPMNRLCENAFPRTIADLEKLSSTSETPNYTAPRDASLLSLNDTLFQCEQILRGMSKLESFNELVSNLKGIIDEEQKLRDNIQKARKEKALDLLKD